MIGSVKKNLIFLNNATGNSESYDVDMHKTLTLFITVNGGSSIIVYGTDEDGNATVLMGLNCADWSNSANVTGVGKYSYDITGMNKVYVAATGASTVKGRMST